MSDHLNAIREERDELRETVVVLERSLEAATVTTEALTAEVAKLRAECSSRLAENERLLNDLFDAERNCVDLKAMLDEYGKSEPE